MTAQPTIPNPGRQPGDEMLTLQEACSFLRIPEGTLRYWRHLGCGPRSFKVGRHVRYWRADLLLWLTEQTNRPHTTNSNRNLPARRRTMKFSRKE
jgi:hypothetical protein